jgi:hypothetical protein
MQLSWGNMGEVNKGQVLPGNTAKFSMLLSTPL